LDASLLEGGRAVGFPQMPRRDRQDFGIRPARRRDLVYMQRQEIATLADRDRRGGMFGVAVERLAQRRGIGDLAFDARMPVDEVEQLRVARISPRLAERPLRDRVLMEERRDRMMLRDRHKRAPDARIELLAHLMQLAEQLIDDDDRVPALLELLKR